MNRTPLFHRPGALLALLLALHAAPALAQDTVLPYNGYLRVDGEPVDGPTTMRFDLYGTRRFQAEVYGPTDGAPGGWTRLDLWSDTFELAVPIARVTPYTVTIRARRQSPFDADPVVSFMVDGGTTRVDVGVNSDDPQLFSATWTPQETGLDFVTIYCGNAGAGRLVEIDWIEFGPANDEPFFTTTKPDVDVHNGRFSVALGTDVPLLDEALLADPVRIGIALQDSAGDWVELANRHFLTSAAYARRADRGGFLGIIGEVSAASVDVHGPLDAENVTASGDITTDGTLSAGSLSSGSTLTLSSTTTVGGAVRAGDNVTIQDGDLVLGTQVAMRAESGDVLTLNPDDDFSSVTLRNAASLGAVNIVLDDHILQMVGSLSFGTSWSWSGTRTSLTMYDMGDNTTQLIGSNGYAICFTGGFRFDDGDIDETGDDGRDIFRLYVDRNSSQWRIVADMKSHNDAESHEVAVVCLPSGPTNVVSRF